MLRFHCSIFAIYFVSTKSYNWDVSTNARQAAMPVGHIFVGKPRGDMKHNNGTLPLAVITIPQASILLLSSCVSHVEFNGPTVGVERERNFYT